MQINSNVGQLIRSENDQIKLLMDGEMFTDDAAIYRKLSSLTGVNAIRDDFNYWQNNNYECYSAKPLWINLEDQSTQHILFDDNIRLYEENDCIVNVRLMNKAKNKYENIDFECYRIFEKCSILQPNLIELLNPHLRRDSKKNHYCEKLKKSEVIYQKMLEKSESHQIIKKCFNERSGADEDAENVDEQALKCAAKHPPVLSKKPKSILVINNSLNLEIADEENKIDTKNKNSSRACSLQ